MRSTKRQGRRSTAAVATAAKAAISAAAALCRVGTLVAILAAASLPNLSRADGAEKAEKAEKAISEAVSRLQTSVRILSAPGMEGRGPGSRGLASAREYIVAGFRTAGLQPGGEGGGFLQSFTPKPEEVRTPVAPAGGKSWGEVTLENVVGLLPGKAGEEGKCVVIGAHYDHLGLSAEGAPHPGADDNASGVAVLLEAASRLAAQGGFRNTLVFVGFSGEEEGMLGARHYVADPACELTRTLAALNLDTVGRMQGEKLFVFGAGTASELPAILKGVNLSIGLADLAIPESAPFGSDQVAFYEKGVPALHFFGGPHEDYHKTTDVESKVNYDGLVKVLDFVCETAAFLADREELLTFVPPGAENAAKQIAPEGPARRVSLGSIPDFARQSGGVLLTGTTAGSPAEAAGLQQGDIIIGIDGDAIDNLGDFSAALKRHQPGDTVEVVFRRGDQEMRKRVGLVERK